MKLHWDHAHCVGFGQSRHRYKMLSFACPASSTNPGQSNSRSEAGEGPHLLRGRLLVRLLEGLQALQEAGPDVDRVNGRPRGLGGPCELPSLGRLHVSSLCRHQPIPESLRKGQLAVLCALEADCASQGASLSRRDAGLGDSMAACTCENCW